MAIKTTRFDVADYITEPQDVFYHLRTELEDYEPQYLRQMLHSILRARGGVERVAAETGFPSNELNRLDVLDDAAVRLLATKLSEAYRPAASDDKVA